MYTFLIIALAVSCTAQKQRIVGGHDADIKNFPYIVSLELKGRQFCGGAILSPVKILTAARCTQLGSASEITVRAGSSLPQTGGQVRTVAKKIQHPLFNIPPLSNNIALLILDEALDLNSAVQTIEIGSSADLPVGAYANFSGWGLVLDGVKATRLQTLQMPKASEADCTAAFPFWYNKDLTTCYGGELGRDACLDDFGGPIVVDGTAIGMYFFGSGLCLGHIPQLFLNIDQYRAFINDNN